MLVASELIGDFELEMMNRMRTVMISALVVSGVFFADAQNARPSARTTSAETGLVGIKLYDTGARVIQVYGSPDEILALGTTSSAGGGGGGGAAGGRGGAAGGDGGTGRTAATGGDFSTNRPDSGKGPALIGDPFNTGESEFRQLRPGADDGGPSGPQGEQGGRASGGANADGGGGAGGGGAAGERTIYTRWVYKRANAHYSFVFDKFNRAVQIEALGLKDSRVRTRKGISFDMHFSEVIRKYGAPDAYEINGDNIVVRYLVKDRVAFRLSRTRPKVPHHVTGVVVAAGKA